MQMRKYVSGLLAATLVAVSVCGCSEAADGSEVKKDYKIALVAAGVFGDQGMNDALLHGMELFTEQTGIKVTSVEIKEFSDHAINAQNFAQQGYDLVLMGGPVSEIIPEIATEYPDTHFLLNKGTIGDVPNVTSVQFDEAGGGFLAGAFAVLMSEQLNGSKTVGWVGGERIPDLEKARYAFSAAARYMGGDCNVVYVGSFSDIAKGKEIALSMYNSGSSIVQAYAGGASNGVYQAAQSLGEEYYAMGCATGQFDLAPDKIIASSVVKYDDFFSFMLSDYAKTGSMESGIVRADLTSGGTGIRFSPEIGDKVPEDIKKQIEELEAKIVSGEIKVPTTEEEYNIFIK